MKFVYCHHVVPREQLYVPIELSFPNTSKYIDVAKQTKTNLDNLGEQFRWFVDHGILSESWSGSKRF